jgi:glycine cleavage system H protein
MDVFGFDFRTDLYYTDHVWAKVEADGNVRVGFDDVVAKGAHEVFFMKVNEEGTSVVQKKKLGLIESRKYTGPIVCPVSGTIIQVNPKVKASGASAVDKDPYDDGYLAIIKPSNLDADLKNLMFGEAYLATFKKDAEAAQDELTFRRSEH